jgi:hypothetical protein
VSLKKECTYENETQAKPYKRTKKDKTPKPLTAQPQVVMRAPSPPPVIEPILKDADVYECREFTRYFFSPKQLEFLGQVTPLKYFVDGYIRDLPADERAMMYSIKCTLCEPPLTVVVHLYYMFGYVEAGIIYAEQVFKCYAPICDQIVGNHCLAEACTQLALHHTVQADLKRAEYYLQTMELYYKYAPRHPNPNSTMIEMVRDRMLRTHYFYVKKLFTQAKKGPTTEVDVAWLFNLSVRSEFTRRLTRRINHFIEEFGEDKTIPVENLLQQEHLLRLIDAIIEKDCIEGTTQFKLDLDAIEMTAARLCHSEDKIIDPSPKSITRHLLAAIVLSVKANYLRTVGKLSEACATANTVHEMGRNTLFEKSPLSMMDVIALVTRIHLDCVQQNQYSDGLMDLLQMDLKMLQDLVDKYPIAKLIYTPLVTSLKQVLQPISYSSDSTTSSGYASSDSDMSNQFTESVSEVGDSVFTQLFEGDNSMFVFDEQDSNSYFFL